MKTALDPRHQKRVKVIQELFSWDAQNLTAQNINIRPKKQPQDEKTKSIIAKISQIDEIVHQCAPEWELDKINRLDLAVLRLAVFELVFEHTEPPKVVIDEAIELAKEFGGEHSPAFVNGALGKALVSHPVILKIIADKLGVEPEKLSPQASLTADLNAGQLEIADLLTTLEKDLGVLFPKDVELNSVGSILDFVDDHSD